MNRPPFLLTLGFMFAAALPATAEQDHHGADLHQRTRSEIRTFLKQHCPEAYTQLQRLEDGSPAAAHEPHDHPAHDGHEDHPAHDDHHDPDTPDDALADFWEHAANLAGEYYRTSEELGSIAAASYLQLRRMEFAIAALTEQFHQTRDAAVQAQVKQKLTTTLTTHFDANLALQKAHLVHARAELDRTARELDATAARRRDIVNQELKQLLYARDEDDESVSPSPDAEVERQSPDRPADQQPEADAPPEGKPTDIPEPAPEDAPEDASDER